MPLDSPAGSDTQLQSLIDRALGGDTQSHALLLDHACDRLLRLTRQMLRGFPKLRRWEQTDDVFQNALIRLHRSLSDVRIESVKHFFALAGVQIRRELLNLTRHYYGPEGLAANHYTDGTPADAIGGSLEKRAEMPEEMSEWTEFHSQVERLPPEELEVMNLLYYDGLSQEEAANLLGISLRTLKRRWQAAKLRLHEELKRGG